MQNWIIWTHRALLFSIQIQIQQSLKHTKYILLKLQGNVCKVIHETSTASHCVMMQMSSRIWMFFLDLMVKRSPVACFWVAAGNYCGISYRLITVLQKMLIGWIFFFQWNITELIFSVQEHWTSLSPTLLGLSDSTHAVNQWNAANHSRIIIQFLHFQNKLCNN